jgi:hypothetical protein
MSPRCAAQIEALVAELKEDTADDNKEPQEQNGAALPVPPDVPRNTEYSG